MAEQVAEAEAETKADAEGDAMDQRGWWHRRAAVHHHYHHCLPESEPAAEQVAEAEADTKADADYHHYLPESESAAAASALLPASVEPATCAPGQVCDADVGMHDASGAPTSAAPPPSALTTAQSTSEALAAKYRSRLHGRYVQVVSRV